MNRRTFIHAAGATGLSLTSRFGFGATDPAVAALLNLLEDSPRELIPRELVRLIRRGLRYEDLLSALALAAKARHHLIYNADEPHDYKFSEAVFDSYAHLANSDWRCYFLSAGMASFKAPARRPGPVVEQMLE